MDAAGRDDIAQLEVILTQELWEVVQQYQQHPQSTLQGMALISGHRNNGKTLGEEVGHHILLLVLATDDRQRIIVLDQCRAQAQTIFLFRLGTDFYAC